MEINVTGDIVERQELLNGTKIVALDGASPDGAWRLSGSVSWNIGLADAVAEGDLTLARDDGAEIFATLVSATIVESAESGDADFDLTLTYEIDGGSAALEGAVGSIDLLGVLAGERFRTRLRLATEPSD